MTEKTINICGKEVGMIYCAATENGFEIISRGMSINVFVPEFGKDEQGNDIITKPAEATIGDYLTLAMAGIIAYYTKAKQETPVTSEDIMYETTPAERNLLISTVIELRSQWYGIPSVVAEELKAEQQEGDKKKEDGEKNA